MIRHGSWLPALALLLLLALAPEPASACSVFVGREPSPAEKRRDARLRIESAAAIVDGEVVRPFRRGGEPALVRAHRVLKGPRQDYFPVGERHSCDYALMEVGQRQRMVLEGGPDLYYLGLDMTDARYEDRLLGSDRRKDWPFRKGTGLPPPAPAGPSVEAAPGLWVGSIRLCRDTVEAVERIKGPGGGPVVEFAFRPAIQPRLAEETRRLTGQVMPLRLDGRLLASPTVMEPIGGLRLHVAGELGDLEAVRSAALGPCGDGAE
jgi:hypothetical protein